MIVVRRAGNVVLVRHDGREMAVVHPLEGMKWIVSSILVFIMLAWFIVSRHASRPLLFELIVGAAALAQMLWGAWGRTEVDIAAGFISVRRLLFGITFYSRKFGITGPAQRQESMQSVKGTVVARHRVLVGTTSKPSTLPIAIDRDGGDVVVEMINRVAGSITLQPVDVAIDSSAQPAGEEKEAAVRFSIPDDLLRKLREQRSPSLPEWSTERLYDAFLLDPGLGPALYLAADGRVLTDGTGYDDTPLREATEHEACIALVVGAKKTGIPELLNLLPPRPADTPPCERCAGTRWWTVIHDIRIVCPDCSGCGWGKQRPG